jgi:hypothetical protein
MSDSEDTVDVNKLAKLLSQFFKYWKITIPALLGLGSAIIAGVNQYNRLTELEQKHLPEQEMAHRYYRKIDSLNTVILILNQKLSTDEQKQKSDEDDINNLFYYKLPKGKWAN